MPHRICKFADGCNLIASFGLYDGQGTQFCSKHKSGKMINLLCKLCDCGKSRPTYNFEGLSANYCKECKTETMVNVNDKKCNCGLSIPTFNYNDQKAHYCAKCKLPDMINVKDKNCVCGKSTNATFSFLGLKPAYCSSCKEEGMIDIYRKKCFCGKVQPCFNYKGLQPEYCKGCKEDGMIQIRKRLCIQCNENQATYNMEGQKAKYCNKCRTKEMINVVDKCKNDKCVGSGNKKYRYYCAFCFQHLFPDDPLTSGIHKKTKEFAVRDFLNSKFDGFIHDNPLWTGNCDCSHRRRIDHRKLIGNTLLCIETDENQHKYYENEDEKIRYDDLYMLHGGKFIFIRFNPDNYVNMNGTKKSTSMSYRLKELEQEIYIQMERINNEENTELLEIHYLFYDGYNYTS